LLSLHLLLAPTEASGPSLPEVQVQILGNSADPTPPSRPTGLGLAEIVNPHRSEIHRLARRYGVNSIRVFGSVALGEANASSDVDLLFDSREPLGLLKRARFRGELQRTLGRNVDLVREEYLKWWIRPQVVADAVIL